jgi:hypothetical protein
VEMQWDSSAFKPGLLLAAVVEGTTWKCSGITVPLHVDCSSYRRKYGSQNMHCKLICRPRAFYHDTLENSGSLDRITQIFRILRATSKF